MSQKRTWIVLCSSHDEAAIWAYRGLLQRGLSPLELVSVEQLVYNLRSVHQVSNEGVALRIELGDGRVLDRAEIAGVLNRFLGVPTEHLVRAAPSDRTYALEELNALVLSWLTCLPNIVNTPAPLGLAGSWRHPSEWSYLAQTVGLPSRPYRQTSRNLAPEVVDSHLPAPQRSLVVVGEETYGEIAPESIRRGAIRLAKLAGTKILEVAFTNGGSEDWAFENANPIPDFRLGGDALLGGLFTVLTQGGGETA